MTFSLPDLWPLLALAFSLCGAIIVGFNQWAKLEGRHLVIWRWAGVAPLFAVAAVLLPLPTDPAFYLAAAAMGLGLTYADVILFNASRTYGGRLTSLYIPLKMLLAFTFWAMLEPHSLLPLLLAPWKLGFIMLGFALCAGSLLFLRRCDVSWPAIVAVLPVAIFFALGDIMAKHLLPAPTLGAGMAPLVGSAMAFLFTTSTVGALGGLMMGGWATPNRTELLKSMLFGAILLTSLTLLLVTLALAPNPGYVAAITMLSSLWLTLLARLRRAEHDSLLAGLALLGGAIAVAIGGH